jgi:hypothetical protein
MGRDGLRYGIELHGVGSDLRGMSHPGPTVNLFESAIQAKYGQPIADQVLPMLHMYIFLKGDEIICLLDRVFETPYILQEH